MGTQETRIAAQRQKEDIRVWYGRPSDWNEDRYHKRMERFNELGDTPMRSAMEQAELDYLCDALAVYDRLHTPTVKVKRNKVTPELRKILDVKDIHLRNKLFFNWLGV